MLYIAELINKTTGNIRRCFGVLEHCRAHADLKAENFTGEVRPAKPYEIQTEIDKLTKQRQSVQMGYDCSPWAMGPQYRAQLAYIDAKLSQLKSALPAEMQEAT